MKENESNVSVTEFEGVMHVRQGNKHSSGQTSLWCKQTDKSFDIFHHKMTKRTGEALRSVIQ